MVRESRQLQFKCLIFYQQVFGLEKDLLQQLVKKFEIFEIN